MKNTYKIDREDMLELTRRMTLSRNCFTRVAGCYCDKNGEVDDTFNTSFLGLKPADKKQNLEMAKTIPFGRTNDQLAGYIFPEEGMKKGSFYQLLCGDQCHYTTESALRKAKKKSAALAARENGLVIPE